MIINKVAKFFFYLFIVFIPLQIKTLVFTENIYDTGFFNPYLTHFIYLSDIFLFLSLFLFSIFLIFNKHDPFVFGHRNLSLLLLLFLLVNAMSLFFSVDRLNSLFYFLRLLELFAVYLLIVNGFIEIKKLLYVFIGLMAFVAIIGLLQFLLQHSLGLHFLGEPILSNQLTGVAKVEIFGNKLLRAYGTFEHPNIFAAYLIFALSSIFFILRKVNRNKRWLLIFFALICFLALLFTFSRGAMVAFVFSFLLYFIFTKFRFSRKYLFLLIPLVLFFILVFGHGETSFIERLKFFDISQKMFFDKSFGVGLGNFTLVMQNYSIDKLMPWNFQPVHNIYLLILNESGIFGFLIFVLLIAYLFFKFLKIKNYYLFVLLFTVVVIGLFDHYFISLYQGQMLFWLFISLGGLYLYTFEDKNLSNVV